MAKILIIEDEDHIAEGLAEVLEEEGFAPTLRGDGLSGLKAMVEGGYDLVLLDVMLPAMDGFDLCQRARKAGADTPVLFLTARGEVNDRIQGLRAGGDDYLPKPFHLEELLLRISALLRRRGWEPEGRLSPGGSLEFGDNRLNLLAREGIAWDGSAITMTEGEARFLMALVATPGEVRMREELMDAIFGQGVMPSTRVLEEMARDLRRRLEPNPNAPRHLLTVPGVGYRFVFDSLPDSNGA